jgi:molybdopterin-guanine dinucleotide biosynthesis protein A
LFGELADLKQANSLFDNINTPQDYARIAQKGVSSEDVPMS